MRLRREKGSRKATSNSLALEKVQSAKALEESYSAEQKAKRARAERSDPPKMLNIVTRQKNCRKQRAIYRAQQKQNEFERQAKRRKLIAILCKEWKPKRKELFEISDHAAERATSKWVSRAGGDPTKPSNCY